jgi:spore maturation protein CgeB
VRFVYFTHSLVSCWNHGNAHFLRGVLRELIHAGHAVETYEPAGAWSLENLVKDHGPGALETFRQAYPELSSRTYDENIPLDEALSGADVVIVHEWNEPWLVAAAGRARRRGARFTLLFHDTHHRAVSNPNAIRTFDLDDYDGVLAFGETLSEIYRHWGWRDRVFTWHEAADTRLFHPAAEETRREGLVWIGNWGDEERSSELESFLLRPAQTVGLPPDIYGVRYSEQALEKLREHGARYRGWLPNAKVPEVFARHLATVHVPRQFYVDLLPGIPTIRVFEALACGIPLVSAPWRDSEGLFRPGQDYLVARDEAETERRLIALRDDAGLRAFLVESGLATIRARHTCAHRARELIAIVEGLRAPASMEICA